MPLVAFESKNPNKQAATNLQFRPHGLSDRQKLINGNFNLVIIKYKVTVLKQQCSYR